MSVESDPIWKDATAYLLTGGLALCGWIGRQVWVRFDGKADRAELKAILERIDEHSEKDAKIQGEICESLADVREHVAKISGKLGI